MNGVKTHVFAFNCDAHTFKWHIHSNKLSLGTCKQRCQIQAWKIGKFYSFLATLFYQVKSFFSFLPWEINASCMMYLPLREFMINTQCISVLEEHAKVLICCKMLMPLASTSLWRFEKFLKNWLLFLWILWFDST